MVPVPVLRLNNDQSYMYIYMVCLRLRYADELDCP